MDAKPRLIRAISVILLVLILSTSTFGIEARSYRLREDFGTAPLSDCSLQYYYYIPCPTYSWFWTFYDWSRGDIVGVVFEIGDVSMGNVTPCDPLNCHTLEGISILDFAGYGTIYPGRFTVEFDVYCSDADGCPVGPSLWNSGPWETQLGWNLILAEPPVCLSGCATDPGPPPSSPRILVTATHTGTEATYPQWALDNISAPVMFGCEMLDIGGLPALYPRPLVSHYSFIHSGYYGVDFEYCPPLWFADGGDTTFDASVFGFLELAWKAHLSCSGPSATKTSTWGGIKSIYR